MENLLKITPGVVERGLTRRIILVVVLVSIPGMLVGADRSRTVRYIPRKRLDLGGVRGIPGSPSQKVAQAASAVGWLATQRVTAIRAPQKVDVHVVEVVLCRERELARVDGSSEALNVQEPHVMGHQCVVELART